MISTDTKLQQLSFIKKNITTPSKDYLEVGSDFIRFSYYQYGVEKHFLLCTQQEAAEYFQRHGFIKCWDLQGEEMMMSVDRIVAHVGYYGQAPTQRTKIEWFSWKEMMANYRNSQFPIYLDRNECKNICAHLEWEKNIEPVLNGRRA